MADSFPVCLSRQQLNRRRKQDDIKSITGIRQGLVRSHLLAEIDKEFIAVLCANVADVAGVGVICPLA
jgi:hypothetical protein